MQETGYWMLCSRGFSLEWKTENIQQCRIMHIICNEIQMNCASTYTHSWSKTPDYFKMNLHCTAKFSAIPWATCKVWMWNVASNHPFPNIINKKDQMQWNSQNQEFEFLNSNETMCKVVIVETVWLIMNYFKIHLTCCQGSSLTFK